MLFRSNILASVSFTNSMPIIIVGVFIGILAIRFATSTFMRIINSNPLFERVSYIVIGMLGIKLTLSYFIPILNDESVDMLFSAITLLAFIYPIIKNHEKKI